jgi:hypothetical protein
MIYCDLAVTNLGGNTAEILKNKFNEVSDRLTSKEQSSHSHQT